MKNILLVLSILFFSTNIMAKDITLPAPYKNGKVSLMEALEKRHSDHAFSNKEISEQDLSNLLWVAYGINREDGKRTVPTAKNEMDLDIYVFNKQGIFLYVPQENLLKEVSNKNQLALFQKQDYMNNVPVVFVYTGGKNDYSAMHAGSAYQNVGLYTASNKLASIVRGFFDKDGVEKVLSLPDEKHVIISQAIGWEE